MNNYEYLAKMVQVNEVFYIDTSALMDTLWFQSFAAKADPVFRSFGKKITIPPAVRSELFRHYGSQDGEKRQKAQMAVNILSQHKALFLVPGGLLGDDEIAGAFADAELLAMLLKNRRMHRQLLITNDRKLSEDAYSLNRQRSCQGSTVYVCFINRFGELCACDCVFDARTAKLIAEQNSAEQEEQTPDMNGERTVSDLTSTVRTEEQPTPPETDHVEEERNPRNSNGNSNDTMKWVLVFGSGAASGYAVGRFGKQIISLVKTVLAFA